MMAELEYALGFLWFLLVTTLAIVGVFGATWLMWTAMHRKDGDR